MRFWSFGHENPFHSLNYSGHVHKPGSFLLISVSENGKLFYSVKLFSTTDIAADEDSVTEQLAAFLRTKKKSRITRIVILTGVERPVGFLYTVYPVFF